VGKFGFDSYNDNMEEISYDRVITETENAWLLIIDGEKNWFPKSKCELDRGMRVIKVPQWLAEQKELV
jgi:hypothetical protein